MVRCFECAEQTPYLFSDGRCWNCTYPALSGDSRVKGRSRSSPTRDPVRSVLPRRIR